MPYVHNAPSCDPLIANLKTTPNYITQVTLMRLTCLSLDLSFLNCWEQQHPLSK